MEIKDYPGILFVGKIFIFEECLTDINLINRFILFFRKYHKVEKSEKDESGYHFNSMGTLTWNDVIEFEERIKEILLKI